LAINVAVNGDIIVSSDRPSIASNCVAKFLLNAVNLFIIGSNSS
jgi:hypothetical protein